MAIAQAPAIGLGRVIAGEYPRLRCKLVDLDPEADDGGVGSLFDEIQSADEEDEVALRGPERYVHRYLPAPGLPAEGARGPAEARRAVPPGGTAARDARWPCPPKLCGGGRRGRARSRSRSSPPASTSVT